MDLLANFQAADIAATSAPNERQKSLFVEKFNALWQLRVFAARQLWFSEMTAISGRLISLVEDTKEAALTGVKLDLQREKNMIELENGLVSQTQGIKNMKKLYAEILRGIDEGSLDADPQRKQFLAYETANHVLFFLNMSQNCKEATTWAPIAFEDLHRRFNIDDTPPEKLMSTWVASASCAGTDIPFEMLARIRKSVTARLAKAREHNDMVAAEDALRGFIALSGYHYLHGEIEKAQMDIKLVIKESAIESNERDEAKYLNACTPILGRCVSLGDIADGVPFDPSRYEIINKVPSYEWYEVGNQ